MENNTENKRDVSQLTVSEIKQLAEDRGITPSEYWEQHIDPKLGESL
jgi:hypothetical protein